MKYCPQCARMDLKRLPDGDFQCAWCKFKGTPREGAMDEINSYKQSIKSGGSPVMTGPGIKNPEISPSMLKQKLESLKGKKTDDFEIM